MINDKNMTQDNEPNKQETSMQYRRKFKIYRAVFILILAIILVCLLVITSKDSGMPTPWWAYAEALSVFLSAFCRLISALFDGKLPDVAKKMNILSLVFLIVFIAIYIIDFFALR